MSVYLWLLASLLRTYHTESIHLWSKRNECRKLCNPQIITTTGQQNTIRAYGKRRRNRKYVVTVVALVLALPQPLIESLDAFSSYILCIWTIIICSCCLLSKCSKMHDVVFTCCCTPIVHQSRTKAPTATSAAAAAATQFGIRCLDIYTYMHICKFIIQKRISVRQNSMVALLRLCTVLCMVSHTLFFAYIFLCLVWIFFPCHSLSLSLS